MSGLKVDIIIAGRKHAIQLADLSRKTFYDSFAPYNTKENMEKFLSTQFTHEMLRQEVGLPENIFLLAMDGKKPVGYVKLRDSTKPIPLDEFNAIEIARIYVEQQAIGKGIGHALMEESVKIAKSLRKEVIWLGVWENNERAVRFYSGWGFEKFSEHIFMLGDEPQTDWLMRKKLEVSFRQDPVW